MTVSQERWLEAQAREKRYWRSRLPTGGFPDNAFSLGKFEYDNQGYRDAAGRVMELVSRFRRHHPSDRILQVGPGPLDIIHLWTTGQKYGLDPLADFFNRHYPLPGHLKIRSIRGLGEKMGFPDGSFDLVLIINVLDHVQDPAGVLSETRRVLKRNGLLYASTNTWSPGGLLLRRLVAPLGVDRAHPYGFSCADLDALCRANGLTDLYRSHRSVEEQYDLMRRSGVPVLRLLVALRIPVFHYISIWRKSW